jgi:membrane dipeptidase
MKLGFFISIFLLLLLTGCDKTPDSKPLTDSELGLKAIELSQKFLIIDTHIDIPYRLTDEWEDISGRTEKGHFDYPRAKEGGLDAAFMSVYIPSEYEQKGGGKKIADELIDMVEGITANNPDKFRVAYSTNDIFNNFNNGIISFPMGMENGTPMSGDLSNLHHFYERGIRYITFAHSKSNHICDSSYDDEILWNGLSPFGEELVWEMNKLGVMIDVSHVTDSTFYDVIEISKTPVIASHSSCRHFTPGWERNMSDEMIKELGIYGGVIMINFGSSFIDSAVQVNNSKHWNTLESMLTAKGITFSDKEADPIIDDYFSNVSVKEVTVSQVADHIDHVVALVGVDHVGFGSDFDGLRFLPKGLEDVTGYPNIIYELLKRGYSEEDIEKICGKNFIRVWKEVEETAKRLTLVED